RNRWTDDVLRHKPDWLAVKIGINDLHQALANTPRAVPPELFENTCDEILSRTREALPSCRFLLVDPFYISLDAKSLSARAQVLRLLPRYIAVVHRMSRKFRTGL